MNDTKELTGNEKIAAWLGVLFKKEINGVKYYDVPAFHIESYNASQGAFRYNQRLDWIIQAVEKIEILGYNTEIYKTQENGYGMVISNGSMYDIECQADSRIEAVNKAVLEFIDYYNTLKQ
jgi:hypothetical protein